MKSRRQIDPVVAHYMRDVDVTLLRENLKLTHEQRLQKLLNFSRFAAALRTAGVIAKRKRPKHRSKVFHGR